MAIGWLAAFKTIPWADVVAYAPDILRGAKKLVGTVRRSEPPVEHSPDTRHSEVLSALNARLTSLEQDIAQMKQETSSAADLISSLAEQNARLVEAVDLLRFRTRVLVILSGILFVGVVASLAIGLFR